MPWAMARSWRVRKVRRGRRPAGRCVYCGCGLVAAVTGNGRHKAYDRTRDHVVARSWGVGFGWVVDACRSCNGLKSQLEWLAVERCGREDRERLAGRVMAWVKLRMSPVAQRAVEEVYRHGR